MDFSALDRFIDSLPAYGIPSSDCLVYYRHQPVYRRSAGYMDLEKNRPIRQDAMYYLYSCSKVITCAAALQLFEQGKFLMTDPVSEYLPEFRSMNVIHQSDGQTGLKPAEKVMEIRHLFSHTSGLSYDVNTGFIKKAAAENPELSTRDFVKAIAQSPLLFEPGTHWSYSLSHDVLGALIEAISGKRFSDYVKENIFDPLGMNDSLFRMDPARSERMPVHTRFDDRAGKALTSPLLDLITISPNIESGGASVISTTEDYMRFAESLCGGGKQILSRKTIDLMRTNCLDGNALADFNWIQMHGYGYGFGVRTMISRAAGGSLSSVGEFGWGGAAGAYVAIDPDAEVTIVYTQHMLNNKEPYVHPRIRNIVYSCIF